MTIIANVSTLAKTGESVPQAAVTALNTITARNGTVVLKSEDLTAVDLHFDHTFTNIERAGCLGKKSSVIGSCRKVFNSAAQALNEILPICNVGVNVVISVDVTNRDTDVYGIMTSAGLFLADVVDVGNGPSASHYERRFDLYGRDSCIAFLEAVAGRIA